MTIPIYKPYLPPMSMSYAHDAIDSTWLSSQGKYIHMVSEKLQEILDTKYVLPVNNGTSACHLIAKATKRKFKINKVICPNNVYIAALNGFLFDNNYELYSVDCDLNTWNYDLNLLDKAIKRHPDATVLIVHNIGNIINVPELQKKYPDTIFVEDNCEGFLGKYNGKQSGTASFASAISFFGNKNITSGEGGAFITTDEDIFHYISCIYSQGQSSTRFVHDELGYNYRMTNVQAAILYGQLEILSEIMSKKNDIFEKYRNAFKNREDVAYQKLDEGSEHANWMFGVRLPNRTNYQTAELYFRNRGIEIRPMFYPISKHKFLNEYPVTINSCKNADTLNQECIILPSYPELTPSEQNHIIKVLNSYVKESF